MAALEAAIIAFLTVLALAGALISMPPFLRRPIETAARGLFTAMMQ